MRTLESRIGWNVPLQMPGLTQVDTYVPGQRATTGGLWHCKGRLGEREYDSETRTFHRTDTPLSRRLVGQVRRARSESMRLQEIYRELGLDPDLTNANYELQFDFQYDSATGQIAVVTWGYRLPRVDNRCVRYVGPSVKNVFGRYRQDLEAYVAASPRT
jgi:hypothetical protein